MTRREALQEGQRLLAEADEGCCGASLSASLDASLLLAEALGLSKTRLIASLKEDLPEAAYAAYREGLARRAAGTPLAYILGRKEFYGRDFLVDPRVLIPRPDTELLVELALALGDELGETISCHEVCSGSGCVALSLACERPGWRVSASDISADALEVARANAAALVLPGRPGGPVDLYRADLLSSLEAGHESAPGTYGLVVANPPYVESPEAQRLSALWGEPSLALDGGADGLDPYRRLIPEAALALAPGGFLLVEADPGQAESLRALFTASGFLDITTRQDLAGLARVTLGRRPWTT